MQQKHFFIALCFAVLPYCGFGNYHYSQLVNIDTVLALQRFVSTTGTDINDCSTSACATLTYALLKSAAGDLISVAAGTYSSTGFTELVVTSGITITGAGIDSTIIDLAYTGEIVLLIQRNSY